MRRRELYEDGIPSVIADAARAFKGNVANPLFVLVAMRRSHENPDCCSSEVRTFMCLFVCVCHVITTS